MIKPGDLFKIKQQSDWHIMDPITCQISIDGYKNFLAKKDDIILIIKSHSWKDYDNKKGYIGFINGKFIRIHEDWLERIQ